jgi:glycerol kinase
VSAPEPLYLAIDQGGHASRALIFDGGGRQHAACTESIETRRSGTDRVEHDPEAMLASVHRAVAAAIATLGPARRRLRAAGLATQRSSIVCWDRATGAALSPIISWQDRRAADWLAGFAAARGRVHELTGLVLSPHYGASKLRWCLDTLEPVQRARAAGRLVCGPLATFVLFHLSRERPLHADPCNASRTLLWDLAARDWSDELLTLFGVPRDLLPVCGPNTGRFGALDLDDVRVPLTVCTGDQPAALFAFGVPDPTLASVNAGTGAFVQCVTGEQPRRAPGLLTSLAWQGPTGLRHVLEGTVNGAGSAIAWAAQELGLDPETAPGRLDEWSHARPEPPLFLNGVSGLGAPFWVSDFPSRFVGDGEPQAKMIAVLESIVFLLQRNVEVMRASGLAPARLRLTGGLAASEYFSGALADLSALPVARPAALEASARGLAFLLAGEPPGWTASTGEQALLLPHANSALQERYARWLEAMNAEVFRASAASSSRG